MEESMSLTATTTVISILGFIFILFGFILLLAGWEIIIIEQYIKIPAGTKTLIGGVIAAIIGTLLLGLDQRTEFLPPAVATTASAVNSADTKPQQIDTSQTIQSTNILTGTATPTLEPTNILTGTATPTLEPTPTTGLLPISPTVEGTAQTMPSVDTVIERELTIDSALGQQLTAKVYFGQLKSLIQRLSNVPFNTDPNYVEAHPTACAGTVVVSNVPGANGVVYAVDLGTGWGGAERVPSPQVAGVDRNVHQQLVVPPQDATSGASWNARAMVQGEGFELTTNSYTLRLDVRTGDTTQWSLDGDGIVECTMP